MGDITNWFKLISREMNAVDETWEDVEAHTLSREELYKKFNDGFGTSSGCSFTLWTKERVYFPVVYDGAEWVESVPRNPCDIKVPHIGGQ